MSVLSIRLLFGSFVVMAGVGLSAQAGQIGRRATTLTSAVPHLSMLADVRSATEITIRWLVGQSATNEPVPPRDLPPLNQFEVAGRRSVQPAFVRERAPEFSPEYLVVILVDVTGREVAWQQVKDPRVVRAEMPGPNLELSGQVLHRPSTEMLVMVPEGLAVAAIRIHEVEWNGTDFVLRELGEVPAGNAR